MHTSSILSALLLAGSALAAPTTTSHKDKDHSSSSSSKSSDKNSCVDRSQDVNLWQVEKFDFHSSYLFTTPAHQNSWGYVNFTLANPAVDYKPQCTASSNQLSDFFYGTLNYNCTVPESAPKGSEASFSFSRPSGELKVNQTWTCPGEGARFEAMGGIKLNLTCHDKTWKNPDWKVGTGDFYSTRFVNCNVVDAEAPIEQIEGVRR